MILKRLLAPSGVVIERGLIRGGEEVSLLVQEGELKKTMRWAGNQKAKVKAIFDDRGIQLLKAQVSQPV